MVLSIIACAMSLCLLIMGSMAAIMTVGFGFDCGYNYNYDYEFSYCQAVFTLNDTLHIYVLLYPVLLNIYFFK